MPDLSAGEINAITRQVRDLPGSGLPPPDDVELGRILDWALLVRRDDEIKCALLSLARQIRAVDRSPLYVARTQAEITAARSRGQLEAVA